MSPQAANTDRVDHFLHSRPRHRPLSATFLVLLVALLFTPQLSLAQKPDAGTYSAEKYIVSGVRGIRVPMRDGVRLSVDVYRPEAEGKFPGILMLTAYSNNTAGIMARAHWYAKRGYAVVLADTRGRFDSDGEFDPYNPKHKTDGYDLIEWFAAQPWCSGRVGTIGASYSGSMQWWAAVTSPPSLKAMVPEVAPPDAFYNCPYQNGVLVCFSMDWAGSMAGRTGQLKGEGPYAGFGANRAKDYMIHPYLTLLERRGVADDAFFRKWITQNRSTDEYWHASGYQRPELYAKVKAPTLNVSGWFDANHPGTPMNYIGMRKHGGSPEAKQPRLIIGAWAHGINTQKVGAVDYGPDNVLDWEGYACRFFDHHLKGEANHLENDAPVSLFVMGENKWRAAKDWPLPETKWTKFFLHSGGRANTLNGDGALSQVSPAEEKSDTYTYDPSHPTPSAWKGGHTEDGAVDTREGASRDDVLVYTSAPLEKDLTVIGPVSAKLFAATSARDTDWMVRLVDVAPDGTTALLCDGVMRARYRDPKNEGRFNPAQLSTIEPESPLEYTIDFWRGTANRFPAGHRLRVEISSSFFPYFLPNLNTGEDNVGLATKPVIAKQRVLHDSKHPTHIVLPVIE